MTELPNVDAYEDPEWDGAWVTCPHCEQDNGVTWTGKKNCTLCNKEFLVADGPLVRKPGEQHEISVFHGPGGQLFYNIKDALSFP